jgi:hypothetical protein
MGGIAPPAAPGPNHRIMLCWAANSTAGSGADAAAIGRTDGYLLGTFEVEGKATLQQQQ